MQISSFGDRRLIVGEGPIWDGETQSLLAVDIVGKRIVEFAPSGLLLLDQPAPEVVLAVFRDHHSDLVVAMGDGLFRCDPEGRYEKIAHLPLRPGARLNDAKVDRQGRIVVVGSDAAMQQPNGSVFRLELDGSVQSIADGFILGNGPCWSPDGTTFYISDSIAKKIYSYHYPVNGPLGERRLFSDTSTYEGKPDGATVDRDGRLWIAICGAGRVLCFEPDGVLAGNMPTPTAWVSSVMFGGPALDRLYLTSLDPSVMGIPGDADCGRLFMMDGMGATGIAEPRAARAIAPAATRTF